MNSMNAHRVDRVFRSHEAHQVDSDQTSGVGAPISGTISFTSGSPSSAK